LEQTESRRDAYKPGIVIEIAEGRAEKDVADLINFVGILPIEQNREEFVLAVERCQRLRKMGDGNWVAMVKRARVAQR